MIRRFGDRPHAGRRYRLRPGAYAILRRGGSVLVTNQRDTDEAMQLPGGGIDPGETPLRALHREVREETGWTITAARRLGAFRRFVFMPEYDLWAEKLCHVYLARPVRQVSAPTEPLHMAVWCALGDLPRVLDNPGDRAFVSAFLARTLQQHR